MKKIKSYVNFYLGSRTAFILFIEIILGTIICLTSLFLFLKIGSEILEKDVLKFDTYVTTLVYSFRSPQMTEVMLFFTTLASVVVLFLLSVLAIIFISRFRKKDVFICLGILYTGILVNLLLKLFYQRPRPNNLTLIHENSYSFPSGHAMNSFVFFTALYYFFYRETKNITLTIIISAICIFIILMVGLSRIYLGVHYPSDIIGGYIAGFLWFTSAIIFEKIIISNRLYKVSKKK